MDKIHIVCSPDNNYAMPTGVMLCSLCENNKDVELYIHVLYVDLSDDNVKLLRKTVEDYHQSIAFYKIDESKLPRIQTFSQQQKLPISTFLRLFIPSVLSLDINKVLYLDGDIIVRKSIEELYRTSLSGHSVAAVPDDILCFTGISKTYNALKYPPSFGYFNAGVLLINLDYWRKNNVEQQFINTINKYKKVLYHNDQDVLNKVFCESKIFIPLTYNFQHDFLVKPEWRRISWEYDEEIEETAHDPAILHFTGRKPWFASCDHPYKEEFLKYKALTVWKDVPLYQKYKSKGNRIVKKMMLKFQIPYNYYHMEWAYNYSDLRKMEV